MDPAAYVQPHFRIRSLTNAQGLNVDSGWAAALDTDATIDAGIRFAVRFEVEETAGEGANNTFKIQFNKNAAGWVDMDAIDNAAGTTPIQVTWSSQWADGDATTDILSGSAATFEAGVAVEGNGTSNAVSPDLQHTEIEFALFMHNIFDVNSQNSDGDEFELRLVEGDGTVFVGAYVNPTITLNMPVGFIGGAYPETHGRIGPYIDTNGNLYAFVESSPGTRLPVCVKSTDGGDTWTIQDGANAPVTADLESLDTVQDGDTIHLAMNKGADAVYHSFRTSDNASPDTWGTIDTAVSSHTAPDNQLVGIEVRSDGDILVFYNRDDAGDTGLYWKTDTGGGFGSENIVDDEAAFNMSGLSTVLGASDLIHIFYKTLGATGPIYHRSLSSADSLSAREQIDANTGTSTPQDRHPFTPSIFWDDGGEEKIMVVYKDADDILYSVVVTDDGTPEARKTASDNTCSASPLDSDKVVATLALNGTDAYLHYANLADDDIYRDKAENDGGWGTDVEEQDAVLCTWISSESFTHSVANGGATVVGYVWDFDAVDAAGETGAIRYDEFVIPGGFSWPSKRRHPSTNILLRL